MPRHQTIMAAVAAGAVAVSGIGIAKIKAATQISPNTTCNSPAACKSVSNAGSGPATAATSKGGTGSTSATKFNSTSSTNFAAGILGLDQSTSGAYNAGVEGQSKLGNGVLGVSTSGNGVTGSSSAGNGVVGFGSSVGVEGSGGTGVEAIAGGTNGTGLLDYANGTGGVAVSANTISGVAYQATTGGGDLFDGYGNGGLVASLDYSGFFAATGYYASGSIITPYLLASGNTGAAILQAYNQAGSSESPTFIAQGNGGPLMGGYTSGGQVFYVDSAGNETISGLLYTAGGCSGGCSETNRHRVLSYATRESQPTIEDNGEAQLVNGSAAVALSPDFANVINTGADYLVFVTPEGDCKGLYIAGKSPSGFEVRELQGGRSNIAFEYRIVAKPYGDHSARLPMITLRTAPQPRAIPRPRVHHR